MLIFLRWIRFLVEEVLVNRTHVILNADETSLTSVEHSGLGMASGRKRTRNGERTRSRDPPDRFHNRVTYLALTSDSPELQPLLPQVVLPKYTQNARPPQFVLDKYALFGFPFEFWHGTKGAVTPGIMQAWVTRIRSIVSSFNSDAWIVLLIDCSTSHLSVQTIAHFRRLGFIIVPIPAKLTWLLQVLDVYEFGIAKKDIRIEDSKHRWATDTGEIPRLDRMQIATNSIRKHVVNRDWSAAFEKLGAGTENRPTSSSLSKYLPPGDITPALPTLQEFADLIGRAPHTGVTQRIYRMIMSGTLELRNQDLAATPRRAATMDLPTSVAAEVAVSQQELQSRESELIIDDFLQDNHLPPAVLNAHRLARNHFITT